MAGDHKCPVCQATFTRPQHVARHMRSHTGDRPYKCQHCGDQFARSDLLSRHVNKCHASDKPPTTTAPTRRKGQHGGSSTRATTSKQACDQCVIATLPCDGANPCSKCVQRKGPCTYVKFQRQTAPSGPGHRHSHSVDSASSGSSLAGSVPRPDELFLGPPPMTVPSMGGAGDLFYPAQFAFNAPTGAHAWDSDSPNPPSLSLSGTDSGADSSSSDPVRFRNSEMMRTALARSGDYPQGGGGAGFAANPNAYYALLQQQQQQQQHVAPNDLWQFPTDFRIPVQQRKVDDGFAQYLPSSTSTQLGGPSTTLNPTSLDFHSGNAGGSNGLYSLQMRRGSIDEFSDGSGVSAPNSAASSSVHLPLDFGSAEQPQGGQQIQPLGMLYQFDENQQPPPSREGRVASSFGSMSLTDGDQPFIGNFNNNMNVDGTAPFFTQHAMKLPPQDSTPRPFRNDESHSGQACNSPRDREAEMRELRDFWKQYLRTPLTGPSLGQTPKAELLNSQFSAFGDAARPTPKRGLSRVASLPSVRTPPDEKMTMLPSRTNNAHSQSHAQLPVVQTADDLKSYEQAVLARKPLNLTFVPRKCRYSMSSSASPQPVPEQQQQIQKQATGVGLGLNSRMYAAPGPLAALRSTDGENSSDDNPPLSDTSSVRPSVKRLASQTLESGTQKRTLFRWGESEDAVDDTDSEADGPSATGSPASGYDASGSGMRMNSMSPSSYHRGMQFAHVGAGTANGVGTEMLVDRFRRQSAPTGLRPNVGGMDMGNGNLSDNSPSPVSYAASPLQASHTHPNGHDHGGVPLNAPQPGLPGIDGSTLIQT